MISVCLQYLHKFATSLFQFYMINIHGFVKYGTETLSTSGLIYNQAT